MTHQSLILLATLLVMAGISFGYGIGRAWDASVPYLQLVWRVLAAMWAIDRVSRECDALFAWCWAHDIRGEPFLDTEAEAKQP